MPDRETNGVQKAATSMNQHNDRASVGLTIHAGVCCAVVAFFAFGVYRLMQPTRMENPGLAAYKAPPATAPITPFAGSGDPVRVAMELDSEAARAALPAPQPALKARNMKAVAKTAKRQHSARARERRDWMRAYAFHISPFSALIDADTERHHAGIC
jgi:hypothetical protein